MNRLLFVVVALACGMALTALTVHAEAPTRVERLVQAQRLPGVRHAKEPTVDELELASAIVEATRGNRTLAALTLTTLAAESGLRKRISEDRCLPRECDHGLAVGLGQSHRLPHGATLQEQVSEAARELVRATKECSGRAPFPIGAIRSYGSGRGCFGAVPREAERLQLFGRIRRAL